MSMEQHHQAAVAAAAAAWDQVRLHHGGPYPPIPMQQGYAFLIFLNTISVKPKLLRKSSETVKKG